MSESSKSHVKQPSFGQRVFLFLGSMDLAITLLLTLAIASIIGTVLQQNQPYTDYIIKFGPFWFEVFEKAGLYDVYSAVWFLAILTLLVISTSVCVIRHTPSMLRDMRNLRTQVQEKSLRVMQHSRHWQTQQSQSQALEQAESSLKKMGFRTRKTDKEDDVLVSAMRGGMNRLGYLFTHIAIVVICVGGLLDGNLPLKLAEWQGRLAVETRDIPTKDIPQISRLAIGEHAFRGSIHIPEGSSAQIAFVAMRDGYLVQELPFKIEVKDFRIEHYATGQPKSFETDLVIYDDDLAEPLKQTISVNHPLIYKGYAIYQASFSDGGSILSLEAWPLMAGIGNEPVEFDTKVFENRQMHWGDNSLRLEVTSFRPFNINPDPTDEDPDNLRNFGPSFGYKFRTEAGEALEFVNYMLPVPKEGRSFYLSGVRTSPAEEFGYLYLPIDAEGGLEGFMAFLSKLNNQKKVENIAHQMMLDTLSDVQSPESELQQSLQKTLETLVAMFLKGGFAEVGRFIDTALPEGERDTLGTAYLGMLREMLSRIYFDGAKPEQVGQITDSETVFLQDSIDAIGILPRYGAPVYLMLTDYDHVEASGLQIAKAPGKSIVYFGCALLVVGVFLLFYLPQRRLWVLVKPSKNGITEVIMAGMSNRNPREFDVFFEQAHHTLEQSVGNSN
jgi:cytochrome c biogenesis protein